MKGVVAGLALAGAMLLSSVCVAETVAGFELLNLDGALVAWKSRSADGTARITYAVARTPSTFAAARNCGALVPPDAMLERSHIARGAFNAEVRAAFDLWQQAANIAFVEIDNDEAADILIGAQGHPIGHAFTNVTYKNEDGPVRAIERSVICLNPEQAWKIGFDGNLDVYDLRFTIAHEIGHAIGLDHPSRSGQLMSFHYDEQFRSLQPGDLAGVGHIYGPKRPTALARHDE